jgi:hypothetical protein
MFSMVSCLMVGDGTAAFWKHAASPFAASGGTPFPETLRQTNDAVGVEECVEGPENVTLKPGS